MGRRRQEFVHDEIKVAVAPHFRLLKTIQEQRNARRPRSKVGTLPNCLFARETNAFRSIDPKQQHALGGLPCIREVSLIPGLGPHVQENVSESREAVKELR